MDQPDHKTVERRAYQLWQERGSPIGSAAEDWFRAEAELQRTGPTPDLQVYAMGASEE
jgi:hypothetical protein